MSNKNAHELAGARLKHKGTELFVDCGFALSTAVRLKFKPQTTTNSHQPVGLTFSIYAFNDLDFKVLLHHRVFRIRNPENRFAELHVNYRTYIPYLEQIALNMRSRSTIDPLSSFQLILRMGFTTIRRVIAGLPLVVSRIINKKMLKFWRKVLPRHSLQRSDETHSHLNETCKEYWQPINRSMCSESLTQEVQVINWSCDIGI